MSIIEITDRQLDVLDPGMLNGILDDIVQPMAFIGGPSVFVLSLMFFAARWDRGALARRARPSLAKAWPR